MRSRLLIVIVATGAFSCAKLVGPEGDHRFGFDETLASLCSVIASEPGAKVGIELSVYRYTRPIYSTGALRAMHSTQVDHSAESVRADDSRDDRLRSEFNPTEIDRVPADPKCRLLLVDEMPSIGAGTECLLLEISRPTRDPFVPPNAARWGIFARLSLAGRQGGSWYWVPLFESKSGWIAGDAERLPISDG